MSDWIRLEEDEFNIGERQPVDRGVEVTLFLSPYDVPRAVRGNYQKEIDRFVIEFKYLLDSDRPSEPLESTVVDKNFKFFDGKVSHRLYKIEIDLNELNADAVQLQVIVQNAIDEFDSVHDRPKNRGRYSVNREVIQNRKDLFKELIGTVTGEKPSKFASPRIREKSGRRGTKQES